MTDAEYYRLEAHKQWVHLDQLMRVTSCCESGARESRNRIYVHAFQVQESAIIFSDAAAKCERFEQ